MAFSQSLVALVLSVVTSCVAFAQNTAPASGLLLVTVEDETAVAVPQAHLTLAGANQTWRCETDFAGRCRFLSLPGGTYRLHAEKLGFYRLDIQQIDFPQTTAVDITLLHEQEVRETVDVVESPPAIDPAKTSNAENLTQREILNVPYPTSRDIRNALPLLPQVVQDMSGDLHIAGSARSQTLNLLDGFDVSNPVPGFMDMRVSADSVRNIEVEPSRYTVQYGRGDSVLNLETGMGDDRFRFTATNFVPSFQNRKGLHFNQWVPRATISGPIKRGRVWFFDSPEIEYNQDIIEELPEGQDRAKSWRTGNLAKIQANFTNSNIFTAEFVVNNFHAPHFGLAGLNPLESTTNQRGASYLGALRDQHYFRGGTLLELGFAISDFSGSGTPTGTVSYVLTPDGPRGSFYAATRGSARRLQWIANLYLQPRQWHGRHEFKVGADFDRITYHREFRRASISALRTDGTLARSITFPPRARTALNNFQGALYAQDRWTPRERLLIEGGMRVDWDQIIREPVVAPRVAATYMLDPVGRTKLSAGIGLFYIGSNLEFISRPLVGERFDQLFASDGVTPLGPPAGTRFLVNQDALQQPRSLNWSLGIEHKLPYEVYVRAEFLQKRLTHGQTFVPAGGPDQLFGDYILTNARENRYDAFTFTARRTFRNVYPMLVSYTRSSARTNAYLDYSADNIVFGPQFGAPLPWDAPNRILAWGWYPFVKKIDLGYSLEWRDGFPFPIVNENQVVVSKHETQRFPRFFSLSIAGERRFQLAGLFLAFRVTIENLTNQRNPTFVNNNLDSPHFLTFSGLGHRVFTGRIRFLGRSKAAKNPPQQSAPQSKP
ncbi:MAG: TonB-dependent receptor domain-containing protein [Terriglobales bacterium]